MIDFKPLMFNNDKLPDDLDLTAAALPIDIQAQDDLIDQKLAEGNPFVALMIQIIHDTQLEPEISANDPSEPVLIDSETIVLPQSDSPEIDILAVSSDEEPSVDSQTFESELTQNTAITWLQSSSYIPPNETPSSDMELLEPANYNMPSNVDQKVTTSSELTLKATEPSLPQELISVDEVVVEEILDNTRDIELSDLDSQGLPFVLQDKPNKLNTLTSALTNQSIVELTQMKSSTPLDTSQQQMPNSASMHQTTHASLISSGFNQEFAKPQSLLGTHTFSIPVPVTESQWGAQFTEQIVWLGKHQDIQSARIKLHPEELGPIEIHLKVLKDSASLSIQSHSAVVRDLVEQTMPRLRELMGAEGIQLQDVQISSDGQAQHFARQDSHEFSELGNLGAEDEIGATEVHSIAPKGLVDTFA